MGKSFGSRHEIISWNSVGWYVALLIGVWGALMGIAVYVPADIFFTLAVIVLVAKFGHALQMHTSQRKTTTFSILVVIGIVSIAAMVVWTNKKAHAAAMEEARLKNLDKIPGLESKVAALQSKADERESIIEGLARTIILQGQQLAEQTHHDTEKVIGGVIGSPDSFCAIYPEIDDGSFRGNVAFVKGGAAPLYDVRVGIWIGSAPGVNIAQGGRTPDYHLKDTDAIAGMGCGLATTIALGPAQGSAWHPIVSDVAMHAEFTARSGRWFEEMMVQKTNGVERSSFVVFRLDQNGKPKELLRNVDKEMRLYSGWPYKNPPPTPQP